METKTCTKCKEEKPLSTFGALSRNPDGKQRRCKECINSAQREKYAALTDEQRLSLQERQTRWSRENKDKVRLQAKRYRSSDKARESAAKRQREHRKKNPDAARSAGERYRQQNLGRFSSKEASRRAAKLQRTPQWADMSAIAELYVEAKRLEDLTGIKHHVDHIVPLQGELVSGLHVPGNLQILPAHENLRKSNTFNLAA